MSNNDIASPPRLHRRAVLGALLALPLCGARTSVQASALPRLVVHRDRNCGCCGAWIDQMKAAGFDASSVETDDLDAIKTRLGVPPTLASCHTAQIAGYVVEGHVPADAIARLLAEKPAARGVAVAGMPIGSPGMEVPGVADEVYEVVLFGEDGARSYGRYRGGALLK